MFPTTLGIEHRIVNGRVYITANPVLDPAEIERRAAEFGPRAGYYFENWDSLYEGWKDRLRALIAEIESVSVPALPEWEPAEVVFGAVGVAQNHYLQENFHRVLALYSKMWHHHTEMLMLGYGAYVVFFQFCQQAFPEISDQTIGPHGGRHRRDHVPAGRRAEGPGRGSPSSSASTTCSPRGASPPTCWPRWSRAARPGRSGSTRSPRRATRGSTSRPATASTTTTCPGTTT